MAKENLHPVHWLVHEERDTEPPFHLSYSEKQKWYYLGSQRCDELSIVKNYDSADVPSPSKGFLVLHITGRSSTYDGQGLPTVRSSTRMPLKGQRLARA